ncbi:MAG: type II secretion system F family protein [Hyphomicrobium sp.]|nr:type II secretion system F family protein [Hyphomicrobium sp.]
MEAVSPASVIEYLNKLGHMAIDVSEGKRAGKGNGAIGNISVKTSNSQITLFTRELAMLLKAGLPLDQCLGFLQSDARSKNMKRLIGDIAGLIRSGKSFHEALEAQGKAFPPIYVSMVRVAEASGTLEPVLDRIVQWREKAQKLRGKALSQVLYPSILIVVAIAAVAIMLLFVVPRFKQMIIQGGTTIPEQARVVIGASDWLIANGHYLLIGLSIAVLAIIFAWQRGLGRQRIETSLLRMPLIGTIMQLNLTIRFCRALGILLENGVALPVAMKLVRDVIGSKFAADVLDETYDALRKGKSFIEPLSRSGLFPPVVVNMLRVGEETGNLTASLSHMADMFEEKLETSVQRTFTILEPVIILLVSGFVAGIIMSILSAVISVNDLAL